jgi:hypothetical protein
MNHPIHLTPAIKKSGTRKKPRGPAPLTPAPFDHTQIYYRLLRPDMTHAGIRFSVGTNRLNGPLDTSPRCRPSDLWFCTLNHIPIEAMPYKGIAGLLIAEVRVPPRAKLVRVTVGVYKTDTCQILSVRPLTEFYRGREWDAWQTNPEFVRTFLPPLNAAQRMQFIQRNPTNLLEFADYNQDEALAAVRGDRDLFKDINPTFRPFVRTALGKRGKS